MSPLSCARAGWPAELSSAGWHRWRMFAPGYAPGAGADGRARDCRSRREGTSAAVWHIKRLTGARGRESSHHLLVPPPSPGTRRTLSLRSRRSTLCSKLPLLLNALLLTDAAVRGTTSQPPTRPTVAVVFTSLVRARIPPRPHTTTMWSAGGPAARDEPTIRAHSGRSRRRTRVAAGSRRAAPTFSKVTLLDSSPCTSIDWSCDTASAATTTTFVRSRSPAMGVSAGTTAVAGGVAAVPARRRRFEPTREARLRRLSVLRASKTCAAGKVPHAEPWEVGAPAAASGVGVEGGDQPRMSGRPFSFQRLCLMTDATPITTAEEAELDSLDAAGWLAAPPSPSALVRAASDDSSRDGELEF